MISRECDVFFPPFTHHINYEYDPLTSDNLGVLILNGISIIL